MINTDKNFSVLCLGVAVFPSSYLYSAVFRMKCLAILCFIHSIHPLERIYLNCDKEGWRSLWKLLSWCLFYFYLLLLRQSAFDFSYCFQFVTIWCALIYFGIIFSCFLFISALPGSRRKGQSCERWVFYIEIRFFALKTLIKETRYFLNI